MKHNKEFVGGLYSLKREGVPISSSVPLDRDRAPAFNSGLKEMLWMSTGCWCLKRSAIMKMIEAYPELTYDGDDNMSGKKIYGLYIPMLKDLETDGIKIKKYLSEDWSYVQRWRDIGGKVYSDTSIVLNHFGEKGYKLWNTEVVVKKRVEEPNIESNEQNISKVGPPLAGFDLGGGS